MEFRPIRFPEDGLAHGSIIEWWYFNGHLKDKEGNAYAFMNCLIKSDVKRLGLPFLSKVPFKTHFTAHSVLSDIGLKRSYPLVDYIVLVSRDSFAGPLLNVSYANPVVTMGELNCRIEETERFCYRVRNERMDLRLTSLKEPLLEGGTGFVDLNSKETYYYSLTNLRAEGAIRVGGRAIDVAGKAWMDHQWADASYCADRWAWFSIQLEGDTEMVCFEYDDGEAKTRLASISHPDGSAEHTDEVSFTPVGAEWKSPKTDAEYPLSWSIQAPKLDIDLEVDAMVKEQEVIYGTVNYWEGPTEVKGTFGGREARGLGFLELMGYPSKWSNLKFAKDEVENTLNRALAHIQENRLMNLIKHRAR